MAESGLPVQMLIEFASFTNREAQAIVRTGGKLAQARGCSSSSARRTTSTQARVENFLC